MSGTDAFASLRAVVADRTEECRHLRELLLLARAEIYHREECAPGEPCRCENGELMRRIDAALDA